MNAEKESRLRRTRRESEVLRLWLTSTLHRSLQSAAPKPTGPSSKRTRRMPGVGKFDTVKINTWLMDTSKAGLSVAMNAPNDEGQILQQK